jgi:hypothetical protein
MCVFLDLENILTGKFKNIIRNSDLTCRKRAAYRVLYRWNQDSSINTGEDMARWSAALCKLCDLCETCANSILINISVYCNMTPESRNSEVRIDVHD